MVGSRPAILVVLVLVLTACSGRGPASLTVGGYALDESRNLVEVVRQVLESEGHTVEVLEFDSREGLMEALDVGEVDLAVEYLASLLAHYGYTPASPGDQALEQLARSREGMLVALAPAHAGRALVVGAGFAGERGVRSVAGLANVVERMVIGGPRGCPASPTCLLGLETVYGYVFEAFVPIDDPGMLAVALEEGQVDAAVLFATDPVILDRDLVILDDDLGMHGRENPLILEQPGTMSDPALSSLVDNWIRLDTDTLRELNARVEVVGRQEAVAEFIGS